MIYDIHTKQAAQETLRRLTGIKYAQWDANRHRERDYQFQDDFVATMIKEFGTKRLPKSYMDMDYEFFHVTTSADQCISIRQNGVLDLQEAYLCKDSELRVFLDAHGVLINLDEETLRYKGHVYDIHYGARPWNDQSVEYKCWLVGRKLYYDYTICGFLSACLKSPYGGMIHRRPEILWEIDELLNTQLSREWEKTHTTYEILAIANGRDICYPYDDESPEEDKVMTYIVMAYNEALYDSSENILLLKNGVQIPPNDILEINPFVAWR